MADTQMGERNRHMLVLPKITNHEYVHFALMIKSQCVFIPPAAPMLLWGEVRGRAFPIIPREGNCICIWRFILTIKGSCLALSPTTSTQRGMDILVQDVNIWINFVMSTSV